MKRVKKLAIGIFLLGQALSGAASAASVTLIGDSVDFTFDDTLMDMFGQPEVSGNTLFFNPVDFVSQSLNGAGYALTNDTINIEVTAHSGWSFATVDLLEEGDYMLLGTGNTANVSGQIRVRDIAMPTVSLTDSIKTDSLLNVTSFSTVDWLANATVDVSAWDTANTLNVTVENLLVTSSSTPASLAFLEKKFVGLTIDTSFTAPVPEAETYSMMLAGLGLMGFMVARRRQRV